MKLVLESGVVSILIFVTVMMISIYGELNKKKKKKHNISVAEDKKSSNDPYFFLGPLNNDLYSSEGDEELQQKAVAEEGVAITVSAAVHSEKAGEMLSGAAEHIAMPEEGISTTIPDASLHINKTQQSDHAASENSSGAFKKRLKENPKDIVLFSEIMTPKFREF